MKATTLTSRNLTAGVHGRRAPLLADGVFGMLIFVATEVMFFTGLISAFVIIRAGIDPWTPPVGVRLPAVATASNTALLLLSGVFLHRAGRWFAAEGNTQRVRTLLGSAALSGACFFLLIGTHGFHAASAAMALVYLYSRLTRNELRSDHLRAVQVFWYFVVGIWPVLYGLVYF
jgi:cytochrome c oxidase subunit III